MDRPVDGSSDRSLPDSHDLPVSNGNREPLVDEEGNSSGSPHVLEEASTSGSDERGVIFNVDEEHPGAEWLPDGGHLYFGSQHYEEPGGATYAQFAEDDAILTQDIEFTVTVSRWLAGKRRLADYGASSLSQKSVPFLDEFGAYLARAAKMFTDSLPRRSSTPAGARHRIGSLRHPSSSRH